MPETSRAQCPGCAANIADDGYSSVLTCAYCGTRVSVHRRDAHAPPSAPEPRPRTERDLLLERLQAEERNWDVRIRAAERIGGADVLLPLLAAAVMMFAVFTVATIYDDRAVDQPWEPLAGCAFWTLGPLAAIVVHRLRARVRMQRAKVIAGHRDEALAPLRVRIAELERPAPLSEKQRRIRTLQVERDETRRRLDRAYLLPEEVRTSGKADFILIPAIGCGIWFVFIGVTMTIITSRPNDEVSDTAAVLFFLVPFVILVFGVIVPLIWRPLRRRARVRRLEAERDEIAPKLQARLNEIESELARLTRS